MTRYAVAVVALTTAWVAFWRDLSVANVASGVVASVVVLALFPYGPRREGLKLRLLPLASSPPCSPGRWSRPTPSLPGRS